MPSSTGAINGRFPRLSAWVRSAPRRPTLWLFVALSVTTLLLQWRSLAGLFQLSPPERVTYQDSLNDGGARLRKEAQLSGDCVFEPEGLALRPNQRVRIIYSFERDPVGLVSISLRFFAPSGIKNRMLVIPESGEPKGDEDVTLNGAPPVDITPYLGSARRFQIRLDAAALADAPASPTLVFDSIQVGIAKPPAFPPLPSILMAWVGALAVYRFLPQAPRKKRGTSSRKARSSAAAPPSGGVGSALRTRATVRVAASALLLAGLLLALGRWGEGRWFAASLVLLAPLWILEGRKRLMELRPSGWTTALTLLGILAVGWMLRWSALPVECAKPIEPDAIGYIHIARSMANPFHTAEREPVLIWQVWLALKTLCDDEIALRAMACLMALAAVGLTYAVGRLLAPAPIALAAALILATSQKFIEQNVRGLRLEGYTVVLLAMAYGFLRMPKKPGWPWALGMGFLCGLTVLSNLSALSFVALFLIYFGARRGWRVFHYPIAFLTVALMILPYALHLRERFGDPFYTSNITAQFYRNQEFKGRSGFPSVDDVARNSYAGPRISLFDYIFHLHSWREIVSRSARGFWTLYFVEAPQYVLDSREALVVLYLLGLVWAAVRGKWDFLALFVGMNLTLLFFAGDPGMFFDPRLSLHFGPFVAILTAAGVLSFGLAMDAKRRLARLHQPSP